MEKENSNYRWVVFIAVLFTYFLIVSQRTAPGLITDQLMIDFRISASVIGLLTSIQFLAYTGLQIPIGILSDRFGPNFFLIIGTLLNGIGTIVYSVAPNEYVLIFAKLLVGIGDSTIWVNLVAILSQWFKPKEFIKLIGFAGMSGSLGFLLATVPFSKWIALTGWRTPFLTVGIILCFCGFLLYLILVKKPKLMRKDSSVVFSETGKLKREKTSSLLLRVCKDRQAWATFLCHFGLVGTYVGFIGSWAVPYGMDVYGLTRSGASQLVMLGVFGAIIGAPLTTWVSGRLNSIKLPFVFIYSIVLVVWLAFVVLNGKPSFSLLIILFFILGFGNGASALTFAIVRESFPVKEVGVISGFANTGGFLSAVLLPSLFGRVLDHFSTATSNVGYHYGFIIPVVFTLLGLIGSMLIRSKEEAKISSYPSSNRAEI